MEIKKLRIAILSCSTGIFHINISQLLRERIYAHSVGDIVAALFHVSPTSEAVDRMVHSVLQQGYDCIVSVGLQRSLYTKQVLDRTGGHPLLFIGVRDPVALGLVGSLSSPGGYCSGVIRHPVSFVQVAKPLMRLAPYRKNLLIPYVPHAEAGAFKTELPALLTYIKQNSDLEVTAVAIEEVDDVARVLHEHRKTLDMVLLLEGCPGERATRLVAKWCWQNEVLLCAPGLRALHAGAACAMGGDLTPYIEATYEMIQDFWERKVPFGKQEVRVIPDNRFFGANIHMLRAIGMQPEEIAALCDHEDVEVVRMQPD